jgi:NAD(P)-dependent dehydrogenase (short-subunit alcohol dehydrogenase family)
VLDLDPTGAPAGAVPLVCDVTDDGQVTAAVEQAARRLGGLDAVVANAGSGAVGSVEAATDDDFRRTFDVNVLGVVRVMRASLPHLRTSSHAVLVSTGSVAADVGLPARAAYSASKGAVHALTRAMAADHLADGIRVCAVAPGTADTPWVQRLLDAADDPEAERRALEARQPSGRLVTPDEVAAAVCHLLDPTAGATTGTVLTVDGGLTGLRLPR